MDLTTDIFLTKLRRLRAQLTVAKHAEYSYAAATEALDLLLARSNAQIERVKSSTSFAPAIRQAILREANFLVARLTYITGIIIRTASVRNAFEVFDPFLDICKALTSENAKLILSSEWQYIPFTHPQNIQELPDFIFIGLPASESDNALIFPCAAHELGHSVWQKHKIQREFNAEIRAHINQQFETSRSKFVATYPDFKDADLDQDMFVQFVKSQVFASVLRQSEELFSDFLGLCLFGESYLYSFEYLIAPRISGKRSHEYPDTIARVQILERVAKEHLKISVENYATSFSGDDPVTDSHDAFVIGMADEVVVKLIQRLFEKSHSVIEKAKVKMPTDKGTEAAYVAFEKGVPTESDTCLGDLVNAAWRAFRASKDRLAPDNSLQVVENLSDLVFKSIETSELKKIDP